MWWICAVEARTNKDVKMSHLWNIINGPTMRSYLFTDGHVEDRMTSIDEARNSERRSTVTLGANGANWRKLRE